MLFLLQKVKLQHRGAPWACQMFGVREYKASSDQVLFTPPLNVTANGGRLCWERKRLVVKWKMEYLWFLSGLFSSIMRELANIAHDGPKWILLDGDIDPMWIESLNTVMDDNKVWKRGGKSSPITYKTSPHAYLEIIIPHRGS